ncbi:MAG: inorganic phosphate transporter [Proteobacteria bacterium]|nr:inorganic phosphate transporter [Pseudomonadota bacterium]
MADMQIYIGLAAIFGLFMAWGIGANDVANAMATSVGSKALTIKQAIFVAAVFEFAGAVLAGGEVTSTIRKGIIDATSVSDSPEILIYGMLAALAVLTVACGASQRSTWALATLAESACPFRVLRNATSRLATTNRTPIASISSSSPFYESSR